MPSEDLLRARRTELQKQFDKLTEKLTAFRAEVAGLAGGARKFELDQDIKTAEEERASIDDEIMGIEEQLKGNDRTRLLTAMRDMDYDRQTTSFRFYLYKRKVGAFLIHGAKEYGHLWALSKLYDAVQPSTTRDPVKIKMMSSAKDVPGMWRILAVKLGVPPGGTFEGMRERVLKQVAVWLKTKNLIIFVFNVSNAGPALFEEITKQFWSPLANAAQGALLENSPGKLMMFLVDSEDLVEQWGVTMENVENKDDILKLPPVADFLIRLPELSAFDKDILINWMNNRSGNCLPLDIMVEVDTHAQWIMDESQGVPESVAHCICKLCQHDYPGEEEWMKLL